MNHYLKKLYFNEPITKTLNVNNYGGLIFDSSFYQGEIFKKIVIFVQKNFSQQDYLNISYPSTRNFSYNLKVVKQNKKLRDLIKEISLIMGITFYEYLKFGLESLEIIRQCFLQY